jgi:hypothetical protein
VISKNQRKIMFPFQEFHILAFINLLHIVKLGHVPSHIPNIDLETSLELIAVLDRFFIPGSEQLTEMIVTKFLSHNTTVKIYSSCMEAGDISYFHILRCDTVRYMLTSNIELRKTEKMFQCLLCSPYKADFSTDIMDILQDRFNNCVCSFGYFPGVKL